MSGKPVPPGPYLPPVAIPPGFTIREMLDDRGMSQKELALRMGRPSQAINEIIQGKKAITASTADQLEAVLGLPQIYWLNRQASFEKTKARLAKEDSILADQSRLRAFPYLDLSARGFVPETRKLRERVINLRKFLNVASFGAMDGHLKSSHLVARLAQTSILSLEKLAVWLRIGELQAEAEQWAPTTFRKKELRSALPDLRRLSLEIDFNVIISELRKIGERSGVVFLFVKEFKGFPTKGMTAWIRGNPYIMLTLHGKEFDQVWFTLFHEIGHVLLHEKRIFVEGKGLTQNNEQEAEANEFAADTLIPPEDYDKLIALPLTPRRIASFADSMKIDPCIILGRLKRERKVKYNDIRFKILQRKISWTFNA